MPTDLERLANLEMRYEYLVAAQAAERAEFKEFKAADTAELKELRGDLAKIKDQLEKAEWWGRGVLYATLGLAGVVTQAGSIATWFKKL